MTALAQALAQAGVIGKEKICEMKKEQETDLVRYKQIQNEIPSFLFKKRYLIQLRDSIKIIKKNGVVQPSIHSDLKEIIAVDTINLTVESNRNLVLSKLHAVFEGVEKKLNPLIKESRDLEKKWDLKKRKK